MPSISIRKFWSAIGLLMFAAAAGRAQINPNQINWPTGPTGCFYAPGTNTCVSAGGGGGSPASPTGSPQINSGSSTFAAELNTYIFETGINGAACDDSTDDTSALNTLLSTVYSAGGGTVRIHGTCLISGQIDVPNNGASTNPKQPTIRITGDSGAGANGSFISSFLVPSVLDMRYNATYGKILTLALGVLEIDHLTLKDGGSDCAAFVYTTNTTVLIHDNLFSGTASGTSACNDAIILGGTTAGVYPVTLTPTIQFGGYGTHIQRNFFDQIRRGVYLREAANAVTVKDNTWSVTCGSSSSAGAIEIGYSGENQVQANIFSGNLFETSNYPYVYVIWGQNNEVFGDTFWDATGTTDYLFHFKSGAALNIAEITTDASIAESEVSDNQQPGGSNAVMNQTWFAGTALAAIQNRYCPDTSGSGTAQSCSTNDGLGWTPVAGSLILYHTTTSNSGTSLTLTVNGVSGTVRVPGSSGWTTTLATSPASIPGGSGTRPIIPMLFDGLYWNALQNGIAGTAGAIYYQTVQANGSAEPQEAKLNLKSGTNATVSCTDNSGAGSTDCTVAAGGNTWPPSASGPTFSPAAGSYSSGTTVTDTCPGSSTPWISSGITPVAGGTGITLTTSQTLYGSCQGSGYFTTGTSAYTITGFSIANSGYLASGASASSANLSTFSNGLTNPSLIVVHEFATSTSITFPVPTDTAGNTYVDCGGGIVTWNSRSAECFYAENTSTIASNVVTIKASASAPNLSGAAFEITGAATSSPIDGGSGVGYSVLGNGTGGSAGANSLTATALTPAGNGDLIVALFKATFEVPSAGTSPNAFTTAVPSSNGLQEYFLQSTSASITATAGDSTSGDTYSAIVIAVKP